VEVELGNDEAAGGIALEGALVEGFEFEGEDAVVHEFAGAGGDQEEVAVVVLGEAGAVELAVAEVFPLRSLQ